MKIRLFKDTDARQTSKLIRLSMLETNKDHYPMSILQPLHDYFTPSKIKQLASERYSLVADEKGLIVGTGSLEGSQLLTIFVHPKHQGKGIGTKIIQHLEGKAEMNKITTLQVHSSITGTDFYSKNGYKKIKTIMSKHAGEQVLMNKEIQ